MKRLLACIGIVTYGLGTIRAESVPISASEGEIFSREIIFEKREGLIHNSGDVKLNLPGVLYLNCEDLQAQQDAAKKFSTIVATTNVVIQFFQQPDSSTPSTSATALAAPVFTASVTNRTAETNWAYCFKAVFIGTNNTVVLTGSEETGLPRIETANATIIAEQLTYNRTTGRFVGSGKSVTRFKVGQFNLGTKPASKTNAP